MPFKNVTIRKLSMRYTDVFTRDLKSLNNVLRLSNVNSMFSLKTRQASYVLIFII